MYLLPYESFHDHLFDFASGTRTMGYSFTKNEENAMCDGQPVSRVQIRPDIRIVGRDMDMVVVEWDTTQGCPFLRINERL